MKSSDIDKSIKVVGSERTLHLMLLEVAKVWDPNFFKGYSEHANSGGSVYDFFLNQEEDSSFSESPFYLEVETHGTGYKLTIGYCIGETCGDGADFEFSNSFNLIENGPSSQWIH